MTEGFWTSERERELIKLVDDGTSPFDVGVIMGISRNAAIGKARRLGAKWSGCSSRPPSQQDRSARRREQRQAAGAKPRKPRSPAIRIPGRPPEPIEAPPEMKQLSFMELEPRQCRWPIDAGPGVSNLYCGTDTKETYCSFHRAHASRTGYVKRDPVAARMRTREMKRAAAEAVRARGA